MNFIKQTNFFPILKHGYQGAADVKWSMAHQPKQMYKFLHEQVIRGEQTWDDHSAQITDHAMCLEAIEKQHKLIVIQDQESFEQVYDRKIKEIENGDWFDIVPPYSGMYISIPFRHREIAYIPDMAKVEPPYKMRNMEMDPQGRKGIFRVYASQLNGVKWFDFWEYDTTPFKNYSMDWETFHDERGSVRQYQEAFCLIVTAIECLRNKETLEKVRGQFLKSQGKKKKKFTRPISIVHKVNYKYLETLNKRAPIDHKFDVMGHWRKCKGVGKDQDGNYNQWGRTWVRECIKGQGEYIKKLKILQ